MSKQALSINYLIVILIAAILSQLPLKSTAEQSSSEPQNQLILPQPILKEGIYYTDSTLKEVFTGYYREYFETGEIKLELFLLDGRPEGTYVVYFSNARIKEVRSYHKGAFHGIWRTYNDKGMLLEQAEYKDGLKQGTWMIWDENGLKRYQMQYDYGKKVGVWSMWDEKGMLVSEKTH